jgi:hypothetical protein
MYLFQPMRYDEAFTFIVFVQQPILIGLSKYSHPNNHVLFTFLSHVAYHFLGNHPFVVRMPAFLAGCAILPASYLVGRVMYNKHAAVVAVALIAGSAYLVEYSTNARGYSIVVLCFLFLIIFGRYLKGADVTGLLLWGTFVFWSVIGLFTIPVMLFPFSAVVGWLTLSALFRDTKEQSRDFLGKLILACIVTIILTVMVYVPVMVVSGVGSLVANQWVRPLPWSELVSQWPAALRSSWENWMAGLPIWYAFAVVLAFAVSLLRHSKLSADRFPLVIAVLLSCLPLAILQRVVPTPRTWLFLLPYFLIVAASGIWYAAGRIMHIAKPLEFIASGSLAVGLALVLAIVMVRSNSIYYINDGDKLQDVVAIIDMLKDNLRSDDGILVECPANYPLEYYFLKNDIPVAVRFRTGQEVNRMFVVVKKRVTDPSCSYSVDDIVAQHDLRRLGFDGPRLFREYESADVYLLERAE